MSNGEKYRSEEVIKLYEEIAQLRNQQFILGTLALTGSGLLFVILPNEIANLPFRLKESILILATMGTLVTLWFLFIWSLNLRKLIVVISEYLKQKDLSHWERWMDVFDSKEDVKIKRGSQTDFVLMAFLLYGVLVCSAICLTILPDNTRFEEIWTQAGIEFLNLVGMICIVLIIFAIYCGFLVRATQSFKAFKGDMPSIVAKYHNVQNEYYLNLPKKKD